MSYPSRQSHQREQAAQRQVWEFWWWRHTPTPANLIDPDDFCRLKESCSRASAASASVWGGGRACERSEHGVGTVRVPTSIWTACGPESAQIMVPNVMSSQRSV